MKIPEILDIEIQNQGGTSNITVVTDEVPGNIYALDNIEGPYQSQPLFREVPGGKHTDLCKK